LYRIKQIRTGHIIYLAIVIIYCLLFLLQEFAHLQDYSQWIFSGVVLNAKMLGTSLPDYTLKTYPVPNSFLTVTIALLLFIFDAFWASKLLVVFYIIMFAGIIYLTCKHTFPKKYLFRSIIIFSTIAISSSFWNGYLNYQFALLLLALYYFLMLKGFDSPIKTLLFSLIIFFSHAAVFMVFFIFVCYRNAPIKKYRIKLLALIPSGLLTLWYLYGSFLIDNNIGNEVLSSPIKGGVTGFLLYKIYTFLKIGPFQNFILADGQSFLEGNTALYCIFILISALTLLVLLFNIFITICQQYRKEKFIKRTVLFFSILFLSYLLFPTKLLQVVNIGERFMIVGLMFLLFNVSLNHRVLASLTVVCIFFTAYNFFFLSTTIESDVVINKNIISQIDNEKLLSEDFQKFYTNTRQKYLNHRIYQGIDHYHAIATNDLTKDIFSTGIVIYSGDN